MKFFRYQLRNKSKFFSLLVGVFLALSACATSMLVSENRMKVLLRRAVGEGAGYPRLEAQIFGPKTIFTGVMNADRFTRVIGFWFFLLEPHRPGTTPVVFVHGHSTGPRPFDLLARALDRTRFEPWFTFYATGNTIPRSAALFRQRLALMCEQYGANEVIIVAYSMGGLVARQSLRPYQDGITLPRIPLFIGVANPWGGSEETKFESERSFAPESWEDVADGGAFLSRLFDDPLPVGTDYHYIYGLGGKPDKAIGERNDGILSAASLERPEMMKEAKSVRLYEELNHKNIIQDSKTIGRILELIDQYAFHMETPSARALTR